MKTIKLEMTITSTEEGREAAGGFVATVNIHGDALKTFIQNNLILAGFLDCEPDDFHVTVEFGPHQHVIDGQVMVTGLWHAFVMQPA
jgi:uncharacterized cupin superfamily protein